MIIGFSRYGEGASGPALDYLTGYLVNGEARNPKPEVVRGDPDAVAEIIDALPFKRRYTSGVLSFSVEDRVTSEAQEDIMNRFESAVFAGINPDRRSIVWIKHQDKGRTELHFVVPRVVFGKTVKSLNIAPPTPASRHLLDTLRESINVRYGFRDPATCAQEVSIPTHLAKLAAQAKRLGRSAKPDIRQLVTARLLDQARAGAISTRKDVMNFLRAEGFEITRAGANYLTVLSPDTGERVRLKGNIFREHFCPQDLERQPARHDPARLVALERRLERLVEKRGAYHRARYGVEQEKIEPLEINQPSAHDRTRNTATSNGPTPGKTQSGARAAVCPGLLRLNQAAGRFSSATHNIERACQRLGQSYRTFARDFNQALREVRRRQRVEELVRRFAAPHAGRSEENDREGAPHIDHPQERDRDMEMEMEL